MQRISLVIALVGALAFSGIAMATPGGGYGSQPGFAKAQANTVCSGHGAFGAFGAHGDVAHDMGKDNVTNSNGAAPGVDGQAVGAANSSLCGNA
jgi:hypothetical protein